MKHPVYLGNVLHIEDGVIINTPMKSRIEAIQKLLPPTTVKDCKSFCGVVNYLSLFCKDLQKILKPIYELTRETMPFYWSEVHQKVFDHITESVMITHFMVATRSGTSAAGINLPPVHGIQKGINPTLKPEIQSKSQQTLLKPASITPGKRKVHIPIVGRTPAQTPANTKLRSSPSSAKVTPRSLLYTPVQFGTPTLIGTLTRQKFSFLSKSNSQKFAKHPSTI